MVVMSGRPVGANHQRLTPPQRALLDEIKEGGGLYITRWSRYHRTIQALERKGLVRCDEPDYSRTGQDHWVATDAEMS